MNAPGFSVLSGPDPGDRIASSASSRRARSSPAPPAHVARVPLVDDGSDPRRVRADRGARSPSPSRCVPYVATQTGAWAEPRSTRPGLLERAAPIDRALRGRTARARRRARDRSARTSSCSSRSDRDARSPRSPTRRRGRSTGPWHTVATLPTADEHGPGSSMMLRSLGRDVGARRCPSTGSASTSPNVVAGSACRPTRSNGRATGSARRCARPTHVPAEPRDVSDWFYVPEWQPADARSTSRTGPLDGRAGARHGRRCAASAPRSPTRLRRAGARPFVVRRRDGSDAGDADADGRVRGRPRRPRLATSGWRPRSAPTGTARRCHRLLGRRHARLRPTSTPAAYVLFLGALQLGHALGRAHDRAPAADRARGARHRSGARRRPVDPARSFSVGAARVLPQEHPGFRLTPRRRRRRTRRCPTAARRAAAPRLRTRCRAARRRALRRAPTFRRPIADDVDDSDELPDRPGRHGHRWSRPHGHSPSPRSALRVARRPPRAGRPFDLPGSRSSGASRPRTRASTNATREMLRRLADDARPSATTSSCSRPTCATTAQVGRAVDAALRAVRPIDVVVHGAANVGPSAFGPVGGHRTRRSSPTRSRPSCVGL